MSSQIDTDIRAHYISWLTENVRIERHDTGWCELTLPFVDRHNDYIGVYIRDEGGELIISDLGETLIDLDYAGWDAESEDGRAQLDAVLSRFGVRQNDKYLEIRGSTDQAPWLIQQLGQAILACEALAS